MPPRKTAAAPATASTPKSVAAAGTTTGKRASAAPARRKTASAGAKADGAELAFRYIDLLQLIPREPEKISTTQLFERMQALGYDIERRTFERNLRTVADHFGVNCFDESKPYGWAWPRGAHHRSTPAMSQAEALTLLMVKRHLVQMLPTLVVDTLQPQFEQAAHRLNGMLSAKQLSDWQRKVLAVPPTQPLEAPPVPRNVRDVIYSALARNERFRGSYRLKNGTERKDFIFNPLGVVLRGHVTYLVATLFDYPDVRLYAMHRFQRVEPMVGEAAHTPPGFDLERYAIEEQSLGYPGEHGVIELEATFFNNAGQHLTECSLARDQQVEALAPGQHRLKARVLETEQLTWWLLGFGANVRVDGPPHLRERLHHAAQAMLDRYR